MFSLNRKFKEAIVTDQLLKMFELDFVDYSSNDKVLSRDDRQFPSILQSGTHFTNGNYEIPLAFRKNLPKLQNNCLSFTALNSLKTTS